MRSGHQNSWGAFLAWALQTFAKLQESKEILERCCKCVSVTFAAGGHGHIEQPPGAMSWEESCLQSWLYEGSVSLVWVAACGYGVPWAKTWLFGTSYSPLKNMGHVCTHGRDARPVMRGLDSTGIFRSRQTAQYPASLSETFAAHIQGLLSLRSSELDVAASIKLVPRKSMQQGPWAVHDGAGRHFSRGLEFPSCS